MGGSYEDLALRVLVDPRALRSDARLFASLSVALGTAAFPPQHTAAVLPHVLRGPGALRESSSWLRRARTLDACLAFALGVVTMPPDEIDDELFEQVEHTLLALSRDRQGTIATPAAAALGALSARSGKNVRAARELLGEEAVTGASRAEGVKHRRASVARAIRWLLGAEQARSLHDVVGALDAFATAEVLRGLARFRGVAPATADRGARELAAEADATVLFALGEYALALPRAERAALVVEVVRRAEALDAPDPQIELWRGRASEGARASLLAWAEMRGAAATAIPSAAETAMGVLAAVESAVVEIEATGRGPSVDALEATLDIVLCASPLLHDILIATSDDVAQAVARQRRWEAALLALRRGRFERLDKNVRGKHERREAVRRIALALDATPIASEPAPDEPASARKVALRLRALVEDNDEPMLDRPLARAFALAVERAAPEAASIELLGLMLAFGPDAFKKYALEFASGKLVLAARALLELRRAIDVAARSLEPAATPPGRRGKRKLARDLLVALREVSGKLGLIAPQEPTAHGEHEIVRGLDDLVGVAVHLLHQRKPSAAISGVIADAIETLGSGMRVASASLFDEAPPPKQRSASLQRRIDDFLARPSSKAGAEVKREIERHLPPILSGLFEAVFALQGALDREPEPEQRIIGDYQVVRALGAGGMGACLLVRARSSDDERHYVLKLPQRTSAQYRSWFRREALALLSLADHPHRGIVRFVSFHDGLGGKPHLVMEWVDGESLQDRLERAPFPLGEGLRILAELASAVAHAHHQGIGHYDIKPANVVLHMGAEPVLVDWGIAGATCRSRVGTPHYMAPERILEDRLTAPLASDVFSLGCILPELLSGKKLFASTWDAEDEAIDPGFGAHVASVDRPGIGDQVVLARLHTDRKLLAGRVDRLLGPAPDTVREIVKAMLDADPEKRPTARAVEETLRRYE